MRRAFFIVFAALLVFSCKEPIEKFKIQRGVNIAHWLSQSNVRGEQRAAFFVEEDVKRIAGWGFDHVRIPIDEEQMFAEDGSKEEEAFALLRNGLDLCGKYGLRAIVDLHILRSHYFNAAVKPLFTERAAQEAFYECWRKISAELKDYPTDMVAYELMNEPVADDPADWNKIVAECHAAIRELEKDRIIVIGSNRWQSFSTASQLELPKDDPNIILSFHYYEPMLLTHYQASWMDLKDYMGPVHYPGKVVSSEELEACSDTDRALSATWTDAVYDTGRFAKEFGMVLEVAKNHGVPAYCGEYGCLSVKANEESRYNWLSEMNKVLDSLGIARAVWAYREGIGGFGILSGTSNEPDSKMLDCLIK